MEDDNDTRDYVEEPVTEPPRMRVVKEYRKPSSQRTGKRVTGTAMQGVGLAAQGGGAVIDSTGKAVRGVSRAAAAIPFVGAPIAAAGTAAGAGISATGKGVKRAGKVVNRTGRMARRSAKREAREERTGRRRIGASPLTTPPARLPSTADIPLIGGAISKHKAKRRALMLRMMSLGIAVIVAFFNILMVAAFAAADIGSTFVGSFFIDAEDATGMIAVFWFLSALIPIIFLFIARALMKSVANVEGPIKEAMFMVAFVLYWVPFLNIFPHAWWWLKRVGKHPE